MPPTYQTLRRQAKVKIDEAKAIEAKAASENRDITEDEAKQITGFLGEAGQLQAAADRRKTVDGALAAAERSLETTTALLEPAELQEESGAPHRVPAEARDRVETLRRGFTHLGEFAKAVYGAYHGQGVDGRLGDRRAAATGMNQATGADGGFLVPPAFSQTIYDSLFAGAGDGGLMGMCDVYNLDGVESISFNVNAESSRVAGSRMGGVLGYWLAEAGQLTKSKPTFKQMKLEPQELGVLCYVTDKLLRNAGTALAQYLSRAATDEIRFLVGDAIVNGDGVGKPLGIMKAGALITVSKESSQTADTVVEPNLVKMWARLVSRSRGNAVWLVNQDVEPQLDLLVSVIKNLAASENVGGSISSVYNRDNNTIKNRPVVPVEFCGTVGDLGDIILADMKGYALGVRSGVDSQMSMHLRFDYAETAFRFMFAADGQPWLASAITPYKGTNTLGHFVTLQAR